MAFRRSILSAILTTTSLLAGSSSFATPNQAAQQPTAPASVVRPIGTIQSIHGNSITLKSDAGAEVSILVQDSARLLRSAPGQQDLKDATPITLEDLQIGDRVLVRGKIGDDGRSVMASSVIAMKRTDIAEKHQRELQDWQRRGIGGMVKSVDASAGTVSISALGAAGSTTVVIKTTKDTAIRRYAADSVKFDDAIRSTLDQVKPGDQLRARGAKNADGTEVLADEIVSGNFRNIAGLITAVDTEKNTITVNDLATKKPVVVHVVGESGMHRLPQPIAVRLAMRLKGVPAQSAVATGDGANAAAAPRAQGEMSGHRPGSQAGPGEGQRTGTPDLQQMLSRLPAMQFAELAKGDAVMIVTTSGSATTNVTAITLLDGVEPILTASPNGSGAASLLTPWSLGGGGADPTAQ